MIVERRLLPIVFNADIHSLKPIEQYRNPTVQPDTQITGVMSDSWREQEVFILKIIGVDKRDSIPMGPQLYPRK